MSGRGARGKALSAAKKRQERKDKANAAVQLKKGKTQEESDVESDIEMTPVKRGRPTKGDNRVAKSPAKTKMASKTKLKPSKASTPNRKDPPPVESEEEEQEEEVVDDEGAGDPPGGYFSNPVTLTELCRLWQSVPHLYDASDPLHRDPAARRQAEQWIADQLELPGK